MRGRPELGYSYSQPTGYYGGTANSIQPSTKYGVPTRGSHTYTSDAIETSQTGLNILDGLSDTIGVGGFSFPYPLSNRQAQEDLQINFPGKGRNIALTGRTNITQIDKTVYFFESPKDVDIPSSGIKILPTPPPKINYKMVFIKTPTSITSAVPAIPVISKDEEKTIIYVLVKRPEEAAQITIPTVAPPTPSKPEVYFIRYKAQKETKAVDGIKPRPVYGPPGFSGS